jgi:hypothetical protein
MRPLELTVYPLLEKVGRNARPGYIVDKRAVSAAEAYRAGQAKRLTEAELAAEVFSAIFHEAECEVRGLRLGQRVGPAHPAVDHYVKQNHEFGRQAGILERFATLPNYDEVDA